MGDTSLEAKIRDILYTEYGVGDQYIASKEIYDKLIERGIDVPENAMADVFDSLHRSGFIKGRGKQNSEEVRRHGHWRITWVSRYTAL